MVHCDAAYLNAEDGDHTIDKSWRLPQQTSCKGCPAWGQAADCSADILNAWVPPKAEQSLMQEGACSACRACTQILRCPRKSQCSAQVRVWGATALVAAEFLPCMMTRAHAKKVGEEEL